MTIQAMKAYIIIPVHNRRNISLKCLQKLAEFQVFSMCQVIVIDDGSTDHTAEEIQKQYPQVILLSRNGDLWWGGAIVLGMKYAIENNADYLIWLNDDCEVFPDAIEKLLATCEENPNTIVGARSLQSRENPEPSYGGLVAEGLKIKYVYEGECDGLAGNLVCIPRSVVEKIGYLDDRKFPQYFGDVIYTNTAKRNGFRLLIEKDVNTYCQDDNKALNWFEKKYSVSDVIAQRFSKKSSSLWSARIRYEWHFLGLYGVVRYLFWEWLFKIPFFFMMSIIDRFITIAEVKKKLQVVFSKLKG